MALTKAGLLKHDLHFHEKRGNSPLKTRFCNFSVVFSSVSRGHSRKGPGHNQDFSPLNGGGGGVQTGVFPDLDLSFLVCPFLSFLGLS